MAKFLDIAVGQEWAYSRDRWNGWDVDLRASRVEVLETTKYYKTSTWNGTYREAKAGDGRIGQYVKVKHVGNEYVEYVLVAHLRMQWGDYVTLREKKMADRKAMDERRKEEHNHEATVVMPKRERLSALMTAGSGKHISEYRLRHFDEEHIDYLLRVLSGQEVESL